MLTSLRWLSVLKQGLQQQPYCIQVHSAGKLVGFLPLVFVESAIFGRYLVSLSYVNSAGIVAETDAVASQLVDEAVKLAKRCNVRYLELRHEREITHPTLTEKNEAKVLMRLTLPSSTEELWNSFKSKLRSQIRAGEKNGFEVCWGREELLCDFYRVFSHNMRDLGTPVYSRRLFSEILATFAGDSELCVLKLGGSAVAAALLLHTDKTTEVPSASSLRQFNNTNANMVMYWNLLVRAVERGQRTFDFGRSTVESGTYRFKKQWGAEPSPSVWQYHLRQGTIRALRPDNSRFSLAIKMWQRLPVSLTQLIGPPIVRGIP
ncbi:FemAB family XrtA/PEP-CTERM system-associated protein [Anatilimnocola sp. NA78]|uniref:FemAB family XrtA/PEP-CTERM system-associated protein n=1 Tax=Anatilimnocola sp. NA78 TaxID=3415683 RepID=UPI003CE574C3